jgi:hypothetical protein
LKGIENKELTSVVQRQRVVDNFVVTHVEHFEGATHHELESQACDNSGLVGKD